MRVLVFGGNGMLGHKLVQSFGGVFDVWCTLRGRFADVAPCGIFDEVRTLEQVDVTDTDSLRTVLDRVQPEVIVNAAGVIKQVSDGYDPTRLLGVNSVFPRHLASLSAQYGSRLITISTDCVFSGDRGMYTEADLSDARDLYGVSKFLGEVSHGNCLTLRTSIIGREIGTHHSIVEWFLANSGGRVRGFVNAIYSGFPTVVFAEVLADIIERHPDLRGLYHVSSEPINKFDLLKLIERYFKAGVQIEPAHEYVMDRSLDSNLFREATGFEPDTWETMIARMAADPTPYDAWSLSTTAAT